MNDNRPRVAVLAGFSPAATAATARALLLADGTLALIGHDLTGVRDGVVRRVVRTADEVLETGETRLVHGCVSCTLRDDVLPTLVRLARQRPGSDLVLALPPAVEPAAVAAAAAAVDDFRIDSIVTVVEAATFLDELSTTDELRHRGLQAADNDHRGVADVVARQVEFADTLLVWDRPGNDDADRARLDALLHRLAPWAAHVRIGDTPTVSCSDLAARLLRRDRYDPATPGILGRALEGYPVGIHDPEGEHGVNAMLFRSRRPFHPRRLHDALTDVTAAALRVRGVTWLAARPEVAVGWESAGGGVLLGTLAPWLAALPVERWDEASDLRRLAADLDWDPYYGDRRTLLSIVGIGLDVAATARLLAACLLTDAELAEGPEWWSTLPDPFFTVDTGAAPAAAGRPDSD